MTMQSARHVVGCILGTAVGDALGLPYEGLSRRRAAKLLGPPDRYRFLFGRGMLSDDTEHVCLVAQSLIAAGDDVTVFRSQLAQRLRWWFLAIPAGIGFATLRALLKLSLGVSPQRSGVFSAGNGPAMRAAIIGAVVDDRRLLRQVVQASTRLTHTDPKAEYGAVAVALAARMARTSTILDAQQFMDELSACLDTQASEFVDLVQRAVDSVHAEQTTPAFASSLGLDKGVSGYVYHTVPVAIHAWLSHPQDYASAVTSLVACAGDTDTSAAIVGGIVGCAVGKEGIPTTWLSGLRDWPRSSIWLEQLALQLHQVTVTKQLDKPLSLAPGAVLLRNAFFLAVVLSHGFRRLFPPY